MMRLAALGTALLLAGCSDSSIAPERQTAVLAKLGAELAPVAPRLVAIWAPDDGFGGLVCGEIEAPPLLRPEQSTARFISFGRDLYLEPHLLAIDPVGRQLAAESATIFNQTWANACRPQAPLLRRIVGWFTWPDDDSSATPLTNLYTGTLTRQR